MYQTQLAVIFMLHQVTAELTLCFVNCNNTCKDYQNNKKIQSEQLKALIPLLIF